MKYAIFITIMLFSATQIISRTSVDKREDFMFSEKVKKVEVTEMHAFPHTGNIMSLYIFDQEGNMLRHCYYSDNIPRIEIHFYENGLNTESFYSFNTRYYIKEYNENGSLHKTMAYDFPDLDIDRMGVIYYGKKIENFDQFKKKYLTDDNLRYIYDYRYNHKNLLSEEITTNTNFQPGSRAAMHGAAFHKETTRYKYNSNGLMTKQISKSDRQDEYSNFICSYEYDNNGRIIHESWKFYKNWLERLFKGSVTHKDYFYNAFGQLTNTHQYRDIDKELETTEYKYSDDGKLAEKWAYTITKGEVKKEFYGVLEFNRYQDKVIENENNDETAFMFETGDFDVTIYSYNTRGDIKCFSRYLLKVAKNKWAPDHITKIDSSYFVKDALVEKKFYKYWYFK